MPGSKENPHVGKSYAPPGSLSERRRKHVLSTRLPQTPDLPGEIKLPRDRAVLYLVILMTVTAGGIGLLEALRVLGY